MENEYIVAPAIRKDNKVRISRFSHAEMISHDGFFKGAEQGFITNLDRFVDRKEALKIAERNNKGLNKLCKSDELYSEDLFKTEFELVKENKRLREYYEEQNEVNAKFIPVQKVKDKIEELEKEKEEYYSQYKIDELNDKILVLQELLGKE